MVVRRVVYRLLFPLAVVLPTWVLISRGIIADGIGWQFVAYLFIAPVLFVALMVIGAVIIATPGVRAAKAVSWPDAAVLIALWLVLIASGFFAYPALAVAAVLLVLGAFWLVVYEFVHETRRRIQKFGEDLQAASQQQATQRPPAAPLDMGEVIVVTSRPVEREPKDPKAG
jgi:Flp pilus assembly protein TadB